MRVVKILNVTPLHSLNPSRYRKQGVFKVYPVSFPLFQILPLKVQLCDWLSQLPKLKWQEFPYHHWIGLRAVGKPKNYDYLEWVPVLTWFMFQGCVSCLPLSLDFGPRENGKSVYECNVKHDEEADGCEDFKMGVLFILCSSSDQKAGTSPESLLWKQHHYFLHYRIS